MGPDRTAPRHSQGGVQSSLSGSKNIASGLLASLSASSCCAFPGLGVLEMRDPQLEEAGEHQGAFVVVESPRQKKRSRPADVAVPAADRSTDLAQAGPRESSTPD